jgi:cyanophycinase
MTCASNKPKEKALEYEVTLTKLGAGRVQSIHTTHCNGQPDKVLAALQRASGVFFVGGQPYRITDAIKDTPIADALYERVRTGMVLAGTSAGALMMPEVVITDGESRTHPTTDTISIGPGMGFLKGVVLDVHYAERGRSGRMLSAIEKFPDCLGLGLDEDAAIVVRGGSEFEVVGSGSVFVFDSRTRDYVDYTPPDRKDVALVGVRLHVLPSGSRFNLETRMLTSAPATLDSPLGKTA